MPTISVPDVAALGGYLREQRHAAELSLRQLADAAGISNPYLSQIERGLKRPSAEILQQLAKGLRISAESLYVRAGILDEDSHRASSDAVDVPAAILADPALTARQRTVLLDVYESFVGAAANGDAPSGTLATASKGGADRSGADRSGADTSGAAKDDASRTSGGRRPRRTSSAARGDTSTHATTAG